jgi:hypothetical protein
MMPASIGPSQEWRSTTRTGDARGYSGRRRLQPVIAVFAGNAIRSTVIDDRVNGTAPLVHTRTSTGNAGDDLPLT